MGQFCVFQNVSLGFPLKHPLETGLAPTVHPDMESGVEYALGAPGIGVITRIGVNYLDSNELSFFSPKNHKTVRSIPSFYSSTTHPSIHIYKDEFTIPAPIPCTDHPRVAVYI